MRQTEPKAKTVPKAARLSPALKRWIDRVLVPNLVDAWLEERRQDPFGGPSASGRPEGREEKKPGASPEPEPPKNS